MASAKRMSPIIKLSPGNKARAKEKQASAKLRGVSKGRSGFDDQSKVEKIYRWITKERPVYTHPFTGEKVSPPKD